MPGVGAGAGVEKKICRLRLHPGDAAYQTSTFNDFGRKFCCRHRPENIKMQEEKEIGSVEIKRKRHLVTEFRLIKGIGDNF